MTVTNLEATLEAFDELQRTIDRNEKRRVFEYWRRLNDPSVSARALAEAKEEKAAMAWASKFRGGPAQ